MALHFMNQQAPNKGLKLSSAAALGALAADMERPLSSLDQRVVVVFVCVQSVCGRSRLCVSSLGIEDDGRGRALRRRVTLICAGCADERRAA